MIWNGSRERLALFFHQINNLAPGMRVIMEIDDFSAVFLDCRFHKGIGWLRMQTLDVELYTKASNYYSCTYTNPLTARRQLPNTKE